MGTLASLSSSFTCDDDVTPYRPLFDAINLPLPADVTSLRVICPKTCPNGCGDGSGETASEHEYQSKPSNVLQLTFESWDGDEVDNVLTVQNMQRVCDVEQRVHSLPDMSKYCLKVPAGATDCSRMSSLCLYMTAQTTLEFTLNPGLDVSIGAANSPEVKVAALLNLLTPGSLPGTQQYQLLSYIPELQLPPETAAALAAQLPPGSISESGMLSGTSKYGVCTVWEPATQEGALYTKISFRDCSIPNGEGAMVSTDAQVLQVAQRLRDSDDVNSKTTFLTKEFIDGKTDKVSATKMVAMFGVPYNVDTFDVAFSLSPLSESDCRSKFTELEVSADTCEGVTSFVSNQMRPQHRFEGPTSKKYVAGTHDPIAKEWWEMLQCGRLLQNYNAQCIEDLNKKEQQFLFDIFADDIMFPELNDNALAGEEPYTYSGEEGELRIYFSEFSRMVQVGQHTLQRMLQNYESSCCTLYSFDQTLCMSFILN
eukprot:SAG31_NODE_338_length_17490_cov_7.707032_13_plen_482_part_00